MRRVMLVALASAVLLLAGCGGTTSPQAALTERFHPISELYPFHVNLSRQSRLYFLVPKALDGSSQALSPIAAVLYRYKGNWSVWTYGSIAQATGGTECDDALGASVPLIVSPQDVAPPKPPKPGLEQVSSPKHLVMVGLLPPNQQPVGSLVLSFGGRNYPATLLEDGYWYVKVRNTGGLVRVSLKDDEGRMICSSGN
jgi:hypothetical protein